MAALPFQNMSGDTEQEYFTATAWSRRSSSRFPHPMAIRHGTCQGQAVDVKQVE
jgi:TolB-like protein